VPDGLAYDANGRLLISCYAPDVIYIVEGGRAEVLVQDPLRLAFSSPTNLAFVPGERTVVVANLGERHPRLFEHDTLGHPMP
jgi:gluconolactonase